MTDLFTIIEIRIKPPHREAYLQAARAFLDKRRVNDDWTHHTTHIDAADPCHCVITVRWHDEDKMKAHFTSSELKAFSAETESYLAQPAIYRTFTIEIARTLL
ncbi:antibiotic biosynthesis monooxygenase [Breoghania sp.]|uniref:putative quinol monooxygenase n=1 Tax=Breoghania sp. TaxID=2065378 RepID=UPI00260BC38B|nr:antibiotic biosynthesis monooxygenase [Breoghania sp.]MDJ0932583.1 antibiotic biosynthesis monooxygenase [Breoghania sp.]